MSTAEAPPIPATVERAQMPSVTTGVWRRRALIGLLFFGLALVMIRPDPRSLGDSFPDLADPVLNSWTLSWSAHAIVTDPLHLFDANIFWPHGNTLAYTDSDLVLLPPFAMLRLFGASEALAFNLISLGLLILALGAAYSLAHWFTSRTDAAIIGAVGYAFGAYTFAHSGHINMLLLGFLPAGFLALFRLLEERTIRRGVLFGLVNLAILLGSLYYAAIYAVCLVIILVGYLVARRFRLGRGIVRPLVVAGVITILALPFLWPYYALDQKRPEFPEWGLKAADFVTPAPGSYLYDSLDEKAQARFARTEHTFFPGFTTYALGVLGLGAVVWGSVRRRGSRRHPPDGEGGMRVDRRLYLWLLLAAATASVVLALGPEVSSVTMPFSVLHDSVPGFSGIRVAARFAVPGLLALAVLASVGFAAASRRLRPRWASIGAIAIGGFLMLELAAPRSLDRLPTDHATVAVYEALAQKPAGAVVELPAVLFNPDPQRALDIAFVEAPRMLYATRDWKPRFNGYSGDWPESYFADAIALNSFPSPEALATMRRLKIRYAILHLGLAQGIAQFSEEQADAVVRGLPQGAIAERHGDAWLVDLPRE